jgi:hypothetical protein
LAHRRLRLTLRETAPLTIAGARVLELGCGHGDIGPHFLALGGDVMFADARPEHVDIVSSRYHGARTLRLDAPSRFPSTRRVRSRPAPRRALPSAVVRSEAAIRQACRVGRRIWLETIVSDSDHPEYGPPSGEEGDDQSFGGTGSRPSPARRSAPGAMAIRGVADQPQHLDLRRPPINRTGRQVSSRSCEFCVVSRGSRARTGLFASCLRACLPVVKMVVPSRLRDCVREIALGVISI